MWPLIFKYAAGITSGLSFFAFVAALYVWLQSRQREHSILQTIRGEGVVDTQTVVRILKEFASDEHRIKALQEMLKYDEGRAKGVVEKVKRVDVGNFSLNTQTHVTHRLILAGFF